MKKETIKAIKQSRDRWKRVVPEGLTTSPSDCALCDRFRALCKKYDSVGIIVELCPIYKKTKSDACSMTPYYNFKLHVNNTHSGIPDKNCSTCQKLANKEVKFLNNLLPKKEKG